MYKNGRFNANNPTNGLFKGILLVKVCTQDCTCHIAVRFLIHGKAFKHIFTSSTSVLKMNTETNDPHLKKRQKCDERCMHSHVASLLGMKSVCPRAIAYIAVQVSLPFLVGVPSLHKHLLWHCILFQLRFALSDCGAWWVIDGEFNYDDFYNNIVDFFENAETPDEKKVIQDLLLWWCQNRFLRRTPMKAEESGGAYASLGTRQEGGKFKDVGLSVCALPL